MTALEGGRKILRKHILENKDRVKLDLENMRKKSDGDDIYNYVDKLSKSLDISNITIQK